MVWGVIVIAIIFLVVGYVVIQGTRAAMAYRRQAAAAGDVEVIRAGSSTGPSALLALR